MVPFGGTETRALVFMDGSLYAGIGDWEDPQLENAQTPGAQVLRLDSPTGSWVEDQDFNQVMPGSGTLGTQYRLGLQGDSSMTTPSGQDAAEPRH
jgi:hypothetical protein